MQLYTVFIYIEINYTKVCIGCFKNKELNVFIDCDNTFDNFYFYSKKVLSFYNDHYTRILWNSECESIRRYLY